MSQQLKKYIITLLALLFCAATIFWLRFVLLESPNIANNKASPSSADRPAVHYALYSNKDFYTGIVNPPPAEPILGKVYGGTVSHHFYAEREIAKFFSRIKNQKVETVVIIGPNHFSQGNHQLLMSQWLYRTPWGEVEPDLPVIQALEKEKIAFVEEQPFVIEHSISALVGFVKYFFPQAKFVPIIINRNVGLEQSRQLGGRLAEILPANSLVLASADFSHHQDLAATEKNDARSLKILQTLDFSKPQAGLVDSPQAVAALMAYVSKKSKNLKFDFENTNSARLGNNLASKDVTSYFFGVYREP